MRYMLLIYDRGADWAKMNDKDHGALLGEYGERSCSCRTSRSAASSSAASRKWKTARASRESWAG